MPNTSAFQNTVGEIRRRLRDLKRYNELWPEELTDPEIEECLALAIQDFNDDLPQTFYTNDDFPDHKLLNDKAIIECYEILINWHSRNVNTANDQGVQVMIHERAQYLQPIVDRLTARTEQRQRRLKAAINLSRGWGGVGSSLRYF